MLGVARLSSGDPRVTSGEPSEPGGALLAPLVLGRGRGGKRLIGSRRLRTPHPNIEKIVNNIKTNDFTTNLFFNKLSNKVIHNIYLRIKKSGIQSFFYSINKNNKYSYKIFNIIKEECNDNNQFFVPLPYHYIIIECMSEIFNNRNYQKWLITPEKRLI